MQSAQDEPGDVKGENGQVLCDEVEVLSGLHQGEQVVLPVGSSGTGRPKLSGCNLPQPSRRRRPVMSEQSGMPRSSTSTASRIAS